MTAVSELYVIDVLSIEARADGSGFDHLCIMSDGSTQAHFVAASEHDAHLDMVVESLDCPF